MTMMVMMMCVSVCVHEGVCVISVCVQEPKHRLRLTGVLGMHVPFSTWAIAGRTSV